MIKELIEGKKARDLILEAYPTIQGLDSYKTQSHHEGSPDSEYKVVVVGPDGKVREEHDCGSNEENAEYLYNEHVEMIDDDPENSYYAEDTVTLYLNDNKVKSYKRGDST